MKPVVQPTVESTIPASVVSKASTAVIIPARRWITASMMLMMVLASLDATVTTTAMPSIIGDLKGLEHYSWVMSIYLLASTIVMPLFGRLSDVLGRKRVILLASGVFMLGSLLAATSQSMGQLIVYRGIQGLGAGGIMPVVLTVIGDIFTLEERGRMQGFFSVIWGTSALAGPALGAFLVKTSHWPSFFGIHLPAGWRSVFWINLPAGLLGMIILTLKYHDRQKPHSTDLDWPGVTTLAVGSTALLAAVSFAAGSEVPPAVPAILLSVAVVVLTVFVLHELRAVNPIMSPKLMVRRAIGPCMVISGLLGLGVFSVDTYVPLYIQGARGGDAAAAAKAVTPIMLAWALSSPVTARFLVRVGFRKMALIGASLSCVGLTGLLLAVWSDAPLAVFTVVLFVTGCGFGPISMVCLLSAQDAVSWQQRGSITSGITFFRNFIGALGVGILGTCFNWMTAKPLHETLAGQCSTSDLLNHQRLASLQQTHPELLKTAQLTIAHGLFWVFVVMVFVAFAQLAVASLIRGKKHEQPISMREAFAAMGE